MRSFLEINFNLPIIYSGGPVAQSGEWRRRAAYKGSTGLSHVTSSLEPGAAHMWYILYAGSG